MHETLGESAPGTLIQSLRHIGPGLILTAGIVGVGELVATPNVAAASGFTLLWLIILGCLVKVFVQIELGRYAVATGMPTLHMLDLLPGPRLRVGWMIWLFLPVYLAMISVVGGMLGGIAKVCHLAGADIPGPLIVAALGVSLALLLGVGRYRLVERLSVCLVVLFTAATVFALGALQCTEYRISAAQIASGLRFGVPEDFTAAFAAFGIIGVGAAELIYYPYWCLEKGYAARVGRRDAGWRDRVQGWMRVMQVDAFASCLLYTGVTVVFFLLGAAVLHTKGLRLSDDGLVATLAQMYLETIGPLGFWVFVTGALATLYSTAFAATAANARLLADILPMLGVLAETADARQRVRRIKWLGVILPLYAAGLYLLWPAPLTLVLISGAGQAVLLPFLAATALYLRHCRLGAELCPGTAWTACLWLSGLTFACVGAWQLFRIATAAG
jgi:Mn2+/Fe2+ NRAMP family transporter